MHLFNVGSMVTEAAMQEMIGLADDPQKLREAVIAAKQMLLQAYAFRVYNEPEDFTSASYIIAANHLTDADAPLIMSYYYERMHKVLNAYPELFVFAKENCFNGVSIPKELAPVLDSEKVFAVDRNRSGGSFATIRTAVKWFNEGAKPKHYLIFAQGTIYDVNRDMAEDIEQGAFWLAGFLGIPVLPAFIEQAVEGAENRLVFGEPFTVPKRVREFAEYKQLWLDRVVAAQGSLEVLTGVPARAAVLDADHQVRKRRVLQN